MLDGDAATSPLERIYYLANADDPNHRIWLINSLPSLLDEIPPADASEYVVELIHALSSNVEIDVRQALGVNLADILAWFFIHCPPSVAQPVPPGHIPQGIFAELVHHLLIDQEASVSEAVRSSMANLVQRDDIPEEVMQHEVLEGMILGVEWTECDAIGRPQTTFLSVRFSSLDTIMGQG